MTTERREQFDEWDNGSHAYPGGSERGFQTAATFSSSLTTL